MLAWLSVVKPRRQKSFGGRAIVFKAEFESRADHHYCTCVIVSQANILVPVLNDVFIITSYHMYRAAFLDCLAVFLCLFGTRGMHDFCWFIIITSHGNQEVPRGRTTQIERYLLP